MTAYRASGDARKGRWTSHEGSPTLIAHHAMADTTDTTDTPSPQASTETPPVTAETAPETTAAASPEAPPAATTGATPPTPAASPTTKQPDGPRSRIGVIAVIALMAIGVYWSRVGHLPFQRHADRRDSSRPPVVRRSGPRDAAARPIRPEEMALFAPLAAGSPLGPATIVGFEGMRDGYLTVNVRLGNTPLSVRLTKSAGNETGRYAFYFMGGSTPQIEATLDALRRVLTANAHVPIPPDLRPFEGW